MFKKFPNKFQDYCCNIQPSALLFLMLYNLFLNHLGY
jgi:hypothetical protein